MDQSEAWVGTDVDTTAVYTAVFLFRRLLVYRLNIDHFNQEIDLFSKNLEKKNRKKNPS